MPPHHARCVLLLHDLPDGSWHHDLMLERPATDSTTHAPPSRLITFRIQVRLDLDPPPPSFDATRLPDHRPDYLDYQGPLSRNRGSVRRLARGLVLALGTTPHTVDFTLDWGRGPTRWLAAPVHPAPPSSAPPESPWFFRLQA